jgi:hypothetical protein
MKYLWLSVTGQPAYEMYDTDPDWAPSLKMGHEELKSDAKRFERQREREKKRRGQEATKESERTGERTRQV